MADNSGLLKEALIKTDKELARRIDAEWIADQWRKRGKQVALYQRYYMGDHDSTITPQQRKMHNLSDNSSAGIREWAANFMPLIVDTPVSRVELESVVLGSDEANEWAMGRLNASKYRSVEKMFYRGAFRDMTSYAIIDPVSVTFSIEPAYNGYDGVVVIYDGQDNVQWACKVWCEGSGESVETN